MNLSELTIIVLSYRRPAYLRYLLNSLVADMPNGQNVQILVRINPDVSFSYDCVIDDFEGYPFIDIKTNDSNIGAMRSFFRALAFVSTDYFWLIGDDDYIRPGLFDKLSQLDAGGMDVILLDYITAKIAKNNSTTIYSSSRLCNASNRWQLFFILPLRSMYLGLISSHILNSKAYSRALSDLLAQRNILLNGELVNGLWPYYLASHCIAHSLKFRIITRGHLVARQTPGASFYKGKSLLCEYTVGLKLYVHHLIRSNLSVSLKLYLCASALSSFCVQFYAKYFVSQLLSVLRCRLLSG